MIVECIQDNWTYVADSPLPLNGMPKKGNLYEVIDMVVFDFGEGEVVYFALFEFGMDHLFRADYFREVNINITDIEKTIEEEMFI